ncbi:MAG TPA: hypothetical protein VF670_08470, partial [Duganella sp.]
MGERHTLGAETASMFRSVLIFLPAQATLAANPLFNARSKERKMGKTEYASHYSDAGFWNKV